MDFLSLLSVLAISLIAPAVARPQPFFRYSNITATPYPTASGNVPSGSSVSAVTANPNSKTANYPILSSGPITAAPSSYGASNFPSAGNYTIPGIGTDQNTTTIHLTSVKHVTIARPRPGGCTINAPNANLLYWNPVTYNYTFSGACPILPESSGGVILAPIVTLKPYTFPISLHAASTRFINFADPAIVSVGNYTTTDTFINLGTTQTFTVSAFTSTYTQHASTETLTGSGVTTTSTYSGTTATGSGTAGTRTYTRTGNTQIGTETNFIFSTPTFAGLTDVLRPDITYNGATYAYTATTPTPYVFFSVLEIQQASITSTITVPVPFLSAYPGKPNVDWSGNSTATGALPSDLIGQLEAYENVNVSNCVVGTFHGQPTLDVGISTYGSLVCVAPARVEKTASDLGPISANPGGAVRGPGPITTTIVPAVPPPSDAGSAPAPVAPTPAATATTTSRFLTPIINNPSPGNSQAPGNNPPGPATTSRVPQTPQQQTVPQAPKPPTTTSGLAGLILSGLGATQTPNPGTTIASVAVPGTPAAGPAPTTLTVGNLPVAISSNNVIINSQTFKPAPGSPPVITTVGNQPVVVNPSQIIAGGTTVAIPNSVNLPAISFIPAEQPPVITIGNSAITANSQSQFIVSSQTLAPGGPAITVGSTQLSIGPPAFSVVIGGNTLPLQPAAAVPLPTMGGQQLQTAANGNVIISGITTLSPGANAATVAGTVVSVMSNGAGLVVGGKTVALPAGAPSSLPTVAGQQIQLAPNGNIVLPGGTTVSAGGSAATISGTPVSILPNSAGVVIGTSTIPLPVGVASALPTVGGQQLQKGPNGNIIIPGVTSLTPGGAAATISGTVVSVAPNGASVVVGSSTIPLAITANLLPSITFSGSTITADSQSQLVIAGQTLSPGSAITVSGTPISLAPGASSAIIGGSTFSLSPGTTAKPLPSITFGRSTITANSQSQVVIAGQTLSPGSAITVSGTPISLAPGASSVVIGGSTFSLSLTATAKPLPSITFEGSTITENSQSQFVIAGQTLSPGSAITIAGTVVSLAPGASDVVIGGSTAFLATPTRSASGSVNVTSFTGVAVSQRGVGRGLVTCLAIATGVLLGVVAL